MTERWGRSMMIFSLTLVIVNCQDYFGGSGYNSYPLFNAGPSFGGNAPMYDDPYFKLMRRSFGQPNGYVMSHDTFDQEKTMDERISAKMNPLPFLFNPGVRQGITTLQQMEARKQQLPTRKLFPSFF